MKTYSEVAELAHKLTGRPLEECQAKLDEILDNAGPRGSLERILAYSNARGNLRAKIKGAKGRKA